MLRAFIAIASIFCFLTTSVSFAGSECTHNIPKLSKAWLGTTARGTVPAVKVLRRDGKIQSYLRSNRSLEQIRGYYSRQLLDLESLRGKVVLDIGTGDGQFVLDLRSHGIEAYGLDIYLHEEQKKLPFFIEADALNTGLASESVDVIFSTASVYYYETDPIILKAALRESARVLRPHGSLSIGFYESRLDQLLEPDMNLRPAERRRWWHFFRTHMEFKKKSLVILILYNQL